MEDKEYICIIPRNLNKPDTLSFGRYEFSLKQIAYTIVGGMAGWYCLQLNVVPFFKIIISTLSLNASLVLAFGKVKGVNADQIVTDSVTYLMRNSYYKRLEKESGMIVTIRSKEEESGIIRKEKSFSV